MFKKVHLTFTALICATAAFAQSGSIQVHAIDKANKQGIPFANVVVYKQGTQVQAGAGTTDINGYCSIKPLDPGQYDIKAVEEGYHDFAETDVVVTPNSVSYVTANMVSSAIILTGATIIRYKTPLVSKNTQTGQTITRQDIQRMVVKDPNSIIAGTSGLYQKDVGGSINAEGARTTSTEYIVDGRKVSATDIFGNQSLPGVPQSMLDQVTAITGGIPAKYGDATGAIIEINTISASPKFFGSISGISSQFLDAFGYNDVNFAVGGPIWSKKDTATHTKNPIIDFVLGGEYTHKKDGSPSFVGGYTVSPDTLSKIQSHPFVVDPLGGYQSAADYITADQITHNKYLPNDPSQSIALNGKLDFHVTKNVNITAGGSYQYNNSRYYITEYELFNSAQNPLNLETSWDGFVRIIQRFPTAQTKGKQSLIQNAYYTIQAEYSNTYDVLENAYLKDKLFEYGYVGKFQQYFSTQYGFRDGDQGFAYYETTPYADSLYTYTPAGPNPLESNYTTQLYSLIGQQNITSSNIIAANGGMLNGSRPYNVYSLWYNTGRAYGGLSKTNNNHLRFTAEFSADIKKHSIQVGFEYEQNVISEWNLTAVDLWNIMRQDVNLQNQQLDTTATPTVVSSGTYATYQYPLSYNQALQTQIDKSIRQKLGLTANSPNYLQPDSYDPSFFSINMFSATDLLNSGNNIVGYMGYDYLGNKGSSNSSIDDFLNQLDGNGNHTYPIAPFHPIYMAGYIQDHFDYKNFKFDVGVRVDRYDANQPVLKDPYLLQPAKTVSELSGTPLEKVSIPSGIGSNYVVYVNDAQSPSAIVGFRNGSTWYNASGTIIPDPSVLAAATTTGNIQPYLENPNQTGLTSAAFTTYTPQVNVMPRIAFAFPISDVAQFFAHYDVLTQRPPMSAVSSVGNSIPLDAFSPLDYMFINSRISTIINNPNLLPQQTIDYELGYTQVLNEQKSAALTLRAFYRENRNDIQTYQYLDAYPTTYLSFNNIDFGTTKGLGVGYDLRRMGNVKLRASYTLMFAKGTGSGPTSGANLANSGQPNLEIPQALDYDQRHTFVVNIDYHYSSGADYNGPVISGKGGKSIQLLANAGFNLNFTAGSGTPYTKQSNATEQGGIGVTTRPTMVGNINGSYMPWQYRVDLKIDKDFKLTLMPSKKDKARKADLLVYIEATNLLNTENILNVYHYTGSPSDDGYLASIDGQQYVAQQVDPQAFSDQYKIKDKQVSYLSIPRELRLGVEFNF